MGRDRATAGRGCASKLNTGEIALRLKTPDSDGTEWITTSPTTFLERLCTLVPRPGKNTILYSSVLAAPAKDRADIVPGEAERGGGANGAGRGGLVTPRRRA